MSQGLFLTVLTPNDIKTIELPIISVEQQNEMIRELEAADDLIRKAYGDRKNQYFDAYEKFGIGAAISKNN